MKILILILLSTTTFASTYLEKESKYFSKNVKCLNPTCVKQRVRLNQLEYVSREDYPYFKEKSVLLFYKKRFKQTKKVAYKKKALILWKTIGMNTRFNDFWN